MKKILSLVLAIVMAATFALAVSADEVKAGNKSDNLVITDGVYTQSNDGQWSCYVLGESTNWECTLTLKTENNNPEYGLQICGKDDNGDGLILENDDSFIQVFGTNSNKDIQLIACDNGWGNVEGYQWGNKTRFTNAADLADVTLTVKLNGNQLSYWIDGAQLGDTITLDEKVMYGNVVTLFQKHNNTSISNVTFVDHNATTDTPATPDNPGQGGTDTPVAPKTGEATAVVALVSVLALAGVVVASKKRA